MSSVLDRLRLDAVAIYDAAVLGVEPRRALTRGLAATPPPERVWIASLGKASFPMAAAAVQHLDRLEIPVAGGVVVTPDEGGSPDHRLLRLAGDHPLPGPRSEAAAAALTDTLAGIGPRDELWVLLSGGTSSLVGAPVDGLAPLEYRRLMEALARAGLPIGPLNRVRKRFSRFGAGRLATAARAERIRVFALSDVPGDRVEDIGSGPCAPDPATAAEVRAVLAALDPAVGVPEVAFRWLDRVERGDLPETPKPDHPAFALVQTRIVGSNAVALDHAAERAATLGYPVTRAATLLAGPAAAAGRALVAGVGGPGPRALLFGGETTVALGPEAGRGGRCQELALAAAGELARRPGPPIVVLAGGTDGRDGPTDAAGAVVDARTWELVAASGIDPDRALERHDAYSALAAAGALLRPGLTGTNVMDVVVVLVGATPPP